MERSEVVSRLGTPNFSEAFTHEGDEFRFTADVSGVDDELSGALGGSGGEDLLSGMDPSAIIGDLFEIRFNLTLPGSITEHNADSINGNTLTWNLDLTEPEGSFEAASTVGGSSNALLFGGIAIAAVAVVGAGVVASRRRKESAALEAVANAPADPIS